MEMHIANNLKELDALIKSRRASKPKHSSERGDLLTYFTETVNADRDGKRFKKLPVRAIAVKLSHLSTQDLYYMKSVMEDKLRRGESAAKWFWWSIKHEKSV